MRFVQKRREAGVPIERLFAANAFPVPRDKEEMEMLRKYVKRRGSYGGKPLPITYDAPCDSNLSSESIRSC